LVTPQFLDKLVQGAFKSHGVKSLKKLVQIYKSACHLSDVDQQGGGGKGKQYHIESRKTFDQVMVMTLTRCHEEFTYHLLGKGAKDPNQSKKQKRNAEDALVTEGHNDDDEVRGENTPLPPKKLMRSFRWKEMNAILQSFFKATLHLLSEGKDSQQLAFVLRALAKYIPLLTPLPKIAQLLLRSLTSLWSAPLDSSEDYQVVRLNAFIRIRQMAITQPFPFIDDCLKKTYLAYAKRAKYGTSATVTSVLPTLTFMGNCIVELYSLDFHSSYQHAFVYIRQLALHLRSALQKKTAEAFQVVYCWQYMHCLKLWCCSVGTGLQNGQRIGFGS
jgi:nucleolar complex protein 2